MTKPSQKQRIAWLDVARGIGIILVVFGHTERGLWSSKILSNEIWQKIDFSIYTFHMPLFFFLSGLTARNSSRGKPYFLKRAKAIIIPYVVFSLLQGIVQLFLAGRTNATTTWMDLLLIPIFPISPFWFFYVLLVYVGIISFLRPGWKMMLVAIVMALLSQVLPEGSGWVLFQILYFFMFYVAAILLPVPHLNNKSGLAAVAIFAATCIGALSAGINTDDYYTLLVLPAAAGGIAGTIWISQKLDFSKVLTFLGRNVLAIYVMHILATAGTRIFLKTAGVEQPAVYLVSGTIAGILLPLIALIILQKLRLAAPLGLPR